MLAGTGCASSRGVSGRAGQVDLGMLCPWGSCPPVLLPGLCLPAQPCAGKAGVSRGAGNKVVMLELVTCSGVLVH